MPALPGTIVVEGFGMADGIVAAVAVGAGVSSGMAEDGPGMADVLKEYGLGAVVVRAGGGEMGEGR